MDELRIEVSRTRADIWHGMMANLLRSPSTLAWYLGGTLSVAGLAVIVSVGGGLQQAIFAGVLASVGMVAPYALMIGVSMLVSVRKTLGLPGALSPIGFTFAPEGLKVAATSGHGQSSWEVWPFAFETRSVFVLRHQVYLLHIIPKRDLTPENVTAVHAALTRYVKKTSMQVLSA